MSDGSKIKQAAENLFRELASDKDKIEFKETKLAYALVFSLKCSTRDYARVIGTGGKNYHAFKQIIQMMAAKDGLEADLKVETPKTVNRPKTESFKPNAKWGKDEVVPLVKAVAAQIFGSGGIVDCVELESSNLIVELKINNEEPLEIIEDSDHVPVLLSTFQKNMRSVFNAISKPNGKSIDVFISPIVYPKPR